MEAMMDEAIDQHATVLFPVKKDGPVQVTRAHAEFQEKHSKGNICTIPFTEGERILGAMTLERPLDEPFDSVTVQLCEHAASLLGPVLDVKRKDSLWLIEKAWESFKHQCKKLAGPRHTAFKLVTYGLAILAVFFMFADGDYRITADASLEGTVQRVIAAPMNGYVGHANARAGDIVRKGQVIFSLDERDLKLERLKWVSQKAQRTREQSEALAEHDRAKAGILAAQIDQADAQIALIEEEIKRSNVVSPFDGIVVSGDLSQSLGAPVERGDVLFQVAPLNDYRVILEVDEREVTNIALDQKGELVLAGAPDEKLPIVVEKITPVSNAAEGQNYFRVEAKLENTDLAALRPGMQGVGKIYVGERKLIWIWTHKITHWLKMFFWSWLP
jgi:RND family efflux transporter MFP subunit